MIELQRNDIFEADVEALVNPVNCVGAMGRGLAFQFRKAFPENYNVYKEVCDRGVWHLGRRPPVRVQQLADVVLAHEV